MQIATLESINQDSCILLIDQPIPIDTTVTMSCLECPQGKNVCTECVFKGHIRDRISLTSTDYELRLELDSRQWNAALWRPRHLISLNHSTVEAPDYEPAELERSNPHKPSTISRKKSLSHAS